MSPDSIFETAVFGDGILSIPIFSEERIPMSEPTRAYGPVEQTDDTRQAQHGLVNDAPVDVNYNAVAARSQSLTIDALGKGFAAAQERRQIIADKDLLPK